MPAVPYIIAGVQQKFATGDTSADSWVPHDAFHALFDPANLDGAWASEKAAKKAKEETKKIQQQQEAAIAAEQQQAKADAKAAQAKSRREEVLRFGFSKTMNNSALGSSSQATTQKKTLLGQ